MPDDCTANSRSWRQQSIPLNQTSSWCNSGELTVYACLSPEALPRMFANCLLHLLEQCPMIVHNLPPRCTAAISGHICKIVKTLRITYIVFYFSLSLGPFSFTLFASAFALSLACVIIFIWERDIGVEIDVHIFGILAGWHSEPRLTLRG
jgi:hypothetical protein